jgi:hypothetical protein
MRAERFASHSEGVRNSGGTYTPTCSVENQCRTPSNGYWAWPVRLIPRAVSSNVTNFFSFRYVSQPLLFPRVSITYVTFFGRFSCTYYAILKKWRFIFLQVPFHELFHYMFKKSKDEASKNWRVIFLQVKNIFQLVLFHIKIELKNKNKQILMDYKI